MRPPDWTSDKDGVHIDYWDTTGHWPTPLFYIFCGIVVVSLLVFKSNPNLVLQLEAFYNNVAMQVNTATHGR